MSQKKRQHNNKLIMLFEEKLLRNQEILLPLKNVFQASEAATAQNKNA